MPIIDPLRPTLVRLTFGQGGDERLLRGLRGGVITTATLRDATGWDTLVREIGQPGLVRHGLRHTALTWMADARHGILGVVVRNWSGEALTRSGRGRPFGGMKSAPDLRFLVRGGSVGLTGFEPATP